MTMIDNETAIANQATIDTPAGTILVLREGKGSAKAGALAVVEGLGLPGNNTLQVRWLRDHGELADGGWFASRFDIYRLQVGDRVRAGYAITARQCDYEGVIESVTAAGYTVVKIESPESLAGRTMGFFDTSLVKIEDEPEYLSVWDEDSPTEEELSEWEKELLDGPAYSAGDTVRVVSDDEWGHYFILGSVATVSDVFGNELSLVGESRTHGRLIYQDVKSSSVEPYSINEDEFHEINPAPEFAEGDIVVITDCNGDSDSAWIGKRFTVWSDEGDSVRLNNAEIDTRPDIPGSTVKFFWDKDQLRAFDPETDFRVGDIVTYHGPSNRGVVTSVENGWETGEFGGDIKVRFTEGEGLAGWEGGASRQFCKLVGAGGIIVDAGDVIEGEEPDAKFAVGDRVFWMAEGYNPEHAIDKWSGTVIEVLDADTFGDFRIVFDCETIPTAQNHLAMNLHALPAPTFEVGDRVVIVGNTDEYHYLAVGTEGTVLSYDAEDDEYMVEGIDFDGYGETQWVDPSDLKLAPVYAEYEDFGFEAGQEIGSVDVLEDLPVGTVLYVQDDEDDPMTKAPNGKFYSLYYDGDGCEEDVADEIESRWPVIIGYVPSV